MVCLKKVFNGEITLHFKRIGTEKHMWVSDFYRYVHTFLKEQISRHL